MRRSGNLPHYDPKNAAYRKNTHNRTGFRKTVLPDIRIIPMKKIIYALGFFEV